MKTDISQMLARNGVRLGALYNWGRCTNADDVAVRFGLKPTGESWRNVDRKKAIAILQALLERDLAYSAELIPHNLAVEIATEFIQHFPEDSAFFSNAKWEDFETERLNVRSIRNWMPATDSTFDSGILVLHRDRVGVYWVEDED